MEGTLEEKLIALVRQLPVMYDTSHTQYMKTDHKRDLWAKIAKQLKISSGDKAKFIWAKLRNNHRDALRRQKRMKTSGIPKSEIKPWKFQSQMEFLLGYMVSRREPVERLLEVDEEGDFKFQNWDDCTAVDVKYEPLSYSDHEDELLEAATHPTSPEHNTRKVDEPKERSREKETSPPRDDLYYFFMSMYEQTKKMPPAVQHVVKREVFQTVSQQEAQLLNITDSTGTNTQRRRLTGEHYLTQATSPPSTSTDYLRSGQHNPQPLG